MGAVAGDADGSSASLLKMPDAVQQTREGRHIMAGGAAGSVRRGAIAIQHDRDMLLISSGRRIFREFFQEICCRQRPHASNDAEDVVHFLLFE